MAEPGSTPFLLTIPDDLVRWLLEDLSAENIRHILSASAFRDRVKGRRIQSISRADVVKILWEEFGRSADFRAHVGSVWKRQRAEELAPLTTRMPAEVARDRRKWMQSLPFPLFYWFCVLSDADELHRLAVNLPREFQIVQAESRRLQGTSWTMSYQSVSSGNSQAKPPGPEERISSLEAALAQAQTESKRVMGELSSALAEVKGLSAQLKSSEKNMKSSRDENVILSGRVRDLEARLAEFSGVEKRIHAFEKAVRKLEHDLERSEALLETAKGDKSAALKKQAEQAGRLSILTRSLAGLARAFSESASMETTRRSQRGTVLVVSKSVSLDPEYYQTFAERGWTLIFYSGFKRTEKTDHILADASRILIMLDDVLDMDRHPDFFNDLLSNEKSMILPMLPPVHLVRVLV